MLDALARALRLDEVERAHLHDLAAPTARHRTASPQAAQRPDPGLLRLMRTLDHVPVLLLGHRGEVLARNNLLTAVLGRQLEPGTSFVRFMFQDPAARERIVNWADFASATVATMRREIARRPYDGLLTTLVDELRVTDRDVARWWDDHTVRDYASVTKRVEHPAAARCPSTSRSSARRTSRTSGWSSTRRSPTLPPPASCPSWPAGTRRPVPDRARHAPPRTLRPGDFVARPGPVPPVIPGGRTTPATASRRVAGSP
ncbi:hypothetical protein ACFQ51_31935 [Streptomyces kaempferi]